MPWIPSARLGIRRAGPKPAGGAIRLELVLATNQPAVVDLIDVTGRRLLTRRIENPAPGSQRLEWDDPGELPAGLYLARLTQGPAVAVVRIIQAR